MRKMARSIMAWSGPGSFSPLIGCLHVSAWSIHATVVSWKLLSAISTRLQGMAFASSLVDYKTSPLPLLDLSIAESIEELRYSKRLPLCRVLKSSLKAFHKMQTFVRSGMTNCSDSLPLVSLPRHEHYYSRGEVTQNCLLCCPSKISSVNISRLCWNSRLHYHCPGLRTLIE